MSNVIKKIALALSIIIAIMVLGAKPCVAQPLREKVEYKSTFLGYKISQDSIRIGRERMRVLMKDCNYSLDQFNTGNKTFAVSTLFQLVGVVCLAGYATNRYLNNQINNNLLISGGVLMGVSIPIQQSAKKQINGSIANYNINCIKSKLEK